MKKYNLSKIMKRAWALVKEAKMTISSALKKAWKEAKNMATELKNVTIKHFDSYNERRYSLPWVCRMTTTGGYDFSERIGAYSANDGEPGDLIVYAPVVGQVYGLGQKDYRRNGTVKAFAKWNGARFIECDKFGRE